MIVLIFSGQYTEYLRNRDPSGDSEPAGTQISRYVTRVVVPEDSDFWRKVARDYVTLGADKAKTIDTVNTEVIDIVFHSPSFRL